MKMKATNATINNPRFNSGEFATIKSKAGLNSYMQDTRGAGA